MNRWPNVAFLGCPLNINSIRDSTAPIGLIDTIKKGFMEMIKENLEPAIHNFSLVVQIKPKKKFHHTTFPFLATQIEGEIPWIINDASLPKLKCGQKFYTQLLIHQFS